MLPYLEQQGIHVNLCGRDSRFQTGQCFFVEASAVLFGPMLESRMHGARYVFESDRGHEETVSQPLWLSMRASDLRKPVNRTAYFFGPVPGSE